MLVVEAVRQAKALAGEDGMWDWLCLPCLQREAVGIDVSWLVLCLLALEHSKESKLCVSAHHAQEERERLFPPPDTVLTPPRPRPVPLPSPLELTRPPALSSSPVPWATSSAPRPGQLVREGSSGTLDLLRRQRRSETVRQYTGCVAPCSCPFCGLCSLAPSRACALGRHWREQA